MVRSLLVYRRPTLVLYGILTGKEILIKKTKCKELLNIYFVTNNYHRKSSVTALIQDLGCTDIQTRKKNFRLTSLYKILNRLISVPISDLSTPGDEITWGGYKNHSNTFKLTPRWDEIPLCTKPYPIGIIIHRLLSNPNQ